ncbi:MAG: sigma-70 family RNA polymerase sigma factor [Clostridia bacterium]
MYSDKILYDKFLQGDNDALEKLIDIYKQSLTLFLYGFLKDMKDSENMMIDVFAMLVVSGGKFKGQSSLKTYLFAIARNEALKYLKKNKSHIRLDEISENLFCSTDFVEVDLLKKESNRQLYSNLKQ